MIKLLVCEDDRELNQFLREELTNAGFSVSSVNNGGDAIVQAVEQSPQLLLLDMLLPGMDGIQVIRVLRKVAPRLPIIGLTGYVGRGYMSQAAAYGVVCLSKPVQFDELVREIRETLRRSGVAVPA